jgi:hypothetical protein
MSAKQMVKLTDDDRRQCHELIHSGTAAARSIMHAHVLLKTDASPEGPGWTDDAIAKTLGVATTTVATLRKTMCKEGLPAALRHYCTGRREYPHKIDGCAEAHLVALACSEPPEGHLRWSLRLLSSQMMELGYVDKVSHTTVGLVLKKTNYSPGAQCAGVSPGSRTRPS